jgi:hypothetical protein
VGLRNGQGLHGGVRLEVGNERVLLGNQVEVIHVAVVEDDDKAAVGIGRIKHAEHGQGAGVVHRGIGVANDDVILDNFSAANIVRDGNLEEGVNAVAGVVLDANSKGARGRVIVRKHGLVTLERRGQGEELNELKFIVLREVHIPPRNLQLPLGAEVTMAVELGANYEAIVGLRLDAVLL